MTHRGLNLTETSMRQRILMIAWPAVGLLAAACGTGSGTGAGTASGTAATATASGHPSGPQSVAGPAAGPAPSGPAPAGYAPWPEAEHDAAHTSQATGRGPQSGHIAWKTNLGSPISPGPAVGPGGTIYESSDAGILYAIDPATGRVQWKFDGGGALGGDDLSTTAAVLPDGTIVWPGPRDTVFGLSARGQRQWAVRVPGVPLSPVIASPTALYVMTTSGVLAALRVDGANTAERWTIKLGHQSLGSPVVRADGVIETTVDDCLIAVRDEGATARQLWQFTVPKKVEVSAAVAADGTAVLGTNDGFEYGISASGRQLWKHATGSPSFSSAAVTSAGTAYYGDNGGVLTVAAAATGSVTRALDAQPGVSTPAANIWTAPLVDSAGDVYYGTNGGMIYGYAPGGRQLFAIPTGKTVDSYPALSAAGDLLIGSDNGYLYAIGS
jgi:outer membrane protein assembly factor BamB